MAVERWSPRKDIERFFEEFMDEPFSLRSLRGFPSLRKMRDYMMVSPAVDMYDNEKEVVVKAEIPGVDKKDIHISVSDNTLTIKGEMKKEEETKEEDYYYSERQYGSFSRRLQLPAKVQDSRIKASFKSGVLEVHLPKAPESKAKEIKVDVK